MKIARYWAKGRAEAIFHSGKRIGVISWGWSESNQDEAERRAGESALRVAKRLGAGEQLPHGYGYSDRPPREEIVQEIRSVRGEVIGTITRNSYGALVLNTKDLMFIDIDLPPEAPSAGISRTLKGLFGMASEDPESLLRKKVAGLASKYSQYTLRLYRTFAGFRCAIINKAISPGSSESKMLLHEFGADPLYVKLCQNQESYRARLTPKYWRCGVQRPPNRFPWETIEEEQIYRGWEREYTNRCTVFATCRLIKQFGEEEADTEMKPLIELHDNLTKANLELQLA